MRQLQTAVPADGTIVLLTFLAKNVIMIHTAIGQLIALQAFVPTVIRQKLAGLQDNMPSMSRAETISVIEKELGEGVSIQNVFKELDVGEVLGSASIAQVHRGKLRDGDTEVAVKVQFPNGERIMMHDLGNFRFLGEILQRTELKFDLVGPINELKRQLSAEFDFIAEAKAMDEIGATLQHLKSIEIPRAVPGLVTRRLLVMTYLHGTPMTRLENAVQHRGGKRAMRRVGRKVLRHLARSYGEMILMNGFFQADCTSLFQSFS